MLILFDQGTPVPLRALLPGHVVATVYELGWSQLPGRSLAIVVLMAASWPRVRRHADHIVAQFAELRPGVYLEIPIP